MFSGKFEWYEVHEQSGVNFECYVLTEVMMIRQRYRVFDNKYVGANARRTNNKVCVCGVCLGIEVRADRRMTAIPCI